MTDRSAPSPNDAETSAKPGEPYCGECGYVLSGLADASKCPECGTPFIDGLRRGSWGDAFTGKRYQSDATLFGLPVLCIALGPDPATEQKRGNAKGIIAIGDTARGGIAIGGVSFGVVAIGGGSVGLFTLGGVSFGLVTAMGGWAMGGLAVGGASVGAIAVGGVAGGYVAKGGGAFGVYANGGGTGGMYQLNRSGRADPQAVEMFDSLSPILGPPSGSPAKFIATISAIDFLIALFIVALCVLAHRSHARRRPMGTSH